MNPLACEGRRVCNRWYEDRRLGKSATFCSFNYIFCVTHFVDSIILRIFAPSYKCYSYGESVCNKSYESKDLLLFRWMEHL